ncbi:hypothetical protein BV898_01414 [Hypsibius exemplaris]|uniref:Uncharacterized protein n=1 Tax=Hypsibius exemplaris TaxID=2072580 RepID=A0A1W0XBE2_HYPEX|nr:hypothetical protein BV898_01414 [Hypsibius exemplaris]
MESRMLRFSLVLLALIVLNPSIVREAKCGAVFRWSQRNLPSNAYLRSQLSGFLPSETVPPPSVLPLGDETRHNQIPRREHDEAKSSIPTRKPMKNWYLG